MTWQWLFGLWCLALLGFFAHRELHLPLPCAFQTVTIKHTASNATRCFNTCRPLFYHSKCEQVVWPTRTTIAGLGHRLTEALFFLRLARMANSCAIYEPFATNEDSHGEEYSWIESDFGLGSGLWSVGAFRTATGCANVPLSRPSYHHCSTGNCFRDPSMAFVVDEARECLQCIARTYGRLTVVESAAPKKIKIVWHVRVGDIELHKPGDTFYNTVWQETFRALQTFAHSPLENIVVGTHSSSYVQHLSALLPNVTFTDGSSRDSMHIMVDADIIIGSGSSFPITSVIFSPKPLYFNHVPKYGYSHGQDYIKNGVWLSANGTVGMNTSALGLHLKRHLERHHQMSVYFDRPNLFLERNIGFLPLVFCPLLLLCLSRLIWRRQTT